MKDIIIVCAGGFGCEVYDIIEHINRKAEEKGKEKPYNLLGFLSDVPVDLVSQKINSKIIGGIQSWYPKGNEVYALGLSNPEDKERLSNLLKSRGAKFETLISPCSNVHKDVEFGEGCIITAYSISRGAKIGNFVNVMGSMVGSGAVIGDYSTTTGFTNITNACLGKRVYVGSHAVIMNNKRIGDDVFIAACSLVVSNIKSGKKVFGVPAKSVDF